ncbi:hypothetical protein SLA2020_382630 [Shorea laevis]
MWRMVSEKTLRKASEKSQPSPVQSTSQWKHDVEPLRSLDLLSFKARHNGVMTQSLKEVSAFFRLKPVMTET